MAFIAVTNPPKKTEYFVGDIFKRYGMEVTATLLEGGTTVINGYDVAAEDEPFTGPGEQPVTVAYGEHTATTQVTVLQSLSLGGLEVANGQRLGDYIAVFNSLVDRLDKKPDTQIDSVIWHGQEKGLFRFPIPDDVTVTIGNEEQPVTEDEETGEFLCELSLGTSLTGTKTTVRLTDGENNKKDYDFTCYSQNFSGMPNRVTDYFCVASQYTNGRGLGPYGINAVGTLRGYEMVDTTTTGADAPPTSLGNFGGYITYWYKDAISDDAKNPFGIDFIVYGNSFDGSNAFAEPGNVYVSEDGDTWYTLAGNLHYDDTAVWPYYMTYTKTDSGKTTWTDSLNQNGTGDSYPRKEFYPLHDWTNDEESVTLHGVWLTESAGVNVYGNIEPPYPHFGYADVGLNAPYIEGSNKASDIAVNPYVGIEWSGFSGNKDGASRSANRSYPVNKRYDQFDLKW
ncbi:MAG: bacterial Ig-like domain-containing protein, partial [Synergistaceae bacterium]|nr:bacterial Ig-like domain-containing protein [Synergistaceae bacterium]